MTLQQKIDKAAIKYNGSNISQRRTVPTRFCNKKNDGEYFVIR